MSEPLDVSLDVRYDLPGDLLIDEAFVNQVLQSAAKLLEVTGEVSVSLVSDEEIHELNRTYRGVDRPTDVLSFALREGEDDEVIWPEDVSEMDLEPLGDIVVSVPTALHQAGDYGHSAKREVGFLLTHGFLHLLGYDHQDEASEAEMMQLSERILQEMGLPRD